LNAFPFAGLDLAGSFAMTQEQMVPRERPLAAIARARMRYVVFGGLALTTLAFVLMFVAP
jgi:hypothetical protein